MGYDKIKIDTTAFVGSMTELIKAIEKATSDGVRDGVSLIERYAKQGFAGQHPPGTPRPVPDDPRPYAITEALKRSIGRQPSQPRLVTRGVYLQTVAPTMIYGRRIELGYNGKGAYPYLGPAVRKATPMLQPIFIQAWSTALRK